MLDENEGLELEAGEGGVHLSQQNPQVSFGSCTVMQTHADIVDPFSVGHELVHAPRPLVILRPLCIARGLVRPGRGGYCDRSTRGTDEESLHGISGRGRSGSLCKKCLGTKDIARDHRFRSGRADEEAKQCQARGAQVEIAARDVPHLGLGQFIQQLDSSLNRFRT